MDVPGFRARVAAFACLLAGGAAFGQVTAEGMGKVVPVHLYTCSYNDGQGPAELERVITRWSKYADDTGLEG